MLHWTAIYLVVHPQCEHMRNEHRWDEVGRSMGTPALPPGPKGQFLVGHLRELQRDQLGFLQRCAREYGDVVPLRYGPRRVILLNHPTAIEEVLVTKSRSFGKGRFYRIVGRLLGNGLVTSEGEF